VGSAKDKRFTIKAIHLLQESSDIEGIDNILTRFSLILKRNIRFLKGYEEDSGEERRPYFQHTFMQSKIFTRACFGKILIIQYFTN